MSTPPVQHLNVDSTLNPLGVPGNSSRTIGLRGGPHIHSTGTTARVTASPVSSSQSPLLSSQAFNAAVFDFNNGRIDHSTLLGRVKPLFEQCNSVLTAEGWAWQMARAKNPLSGETGHADRSILNVCIRLHAGTLRGRTQAPWPEKLRALNNARHRFDEVVQRAGGPDYETYASALSVCRLADHPGENEPISWGLDLTAHMHDYNLLPPSNEPAIGSAMIWACYKGGVTNNSYAPDLKLEIANVAYDVNAQFMLATDAEWSYEKSELHSNALRVFCKIASDESMPVNDRQLFEQAAKDALGYLFNNGVESVSGLDQLSFMAAFSGFEGAPSGVRSHAAALACDLFPHVYSQTADAGRTDAVRHLLNACSAVAHDPSIDMPQRLGYVETVAKHVDPSRLDQAQLLQLIGLCRMGAMHGSPALKQSCAAAALMSMNRLLAFGQLPGADVWHGVFETCARCVENPETPASNKASLADSAWTLFGILRSLNLPLETKHHHGLDCTSYALLIRVCTPESPRLAEMIGNAIGDKVFLYSPGWNRSSNVFRPQPRPVFNPATAPLDHMPPAVGEAIWRYLERRGEFNHQTRVDYGDNASPELVQRIEARRASRGWT